MPVIRPGEPCHLADVAAIQEASPEAGRWSVSKYPEYDFRVALSGGRVVGFLVGRTLAGDERELLNLAVAPESRRRGVARELLRDFLGKARGTVFLEVRESNVAAQGFYKSMGFHRVATRNGYYDNPPEAAIVMKFHSC